MTLMFVIVLPNTGQIHIMRLLNYTVVASHGVTLGFIFLGFKISNFAYTLRQWVFFF